MTTLKQIRDSIDDYIKENPSALAYPVIGFNWFDGQTNKINLIKSHHWLVTDTRSGKEFIYDTIEEINEENFDSSVSIKKIILLS